MRVALIHHQVALKGGMETYLHNLITEFNRQDDHVGAFIYKADNLQAACNVVATNLNFLPRAWRKLYFGWQVHKKALLNQFDVRISLMRAINQDVMICGGTHKGYLQHANKLPKLLDYLEIRLEQQSYNTSSMIIAHSTLLQQELIDLYKVSAEKIITLLPPIDPQNFHQGYRGQRSQIREKYQISPGKTAVFFPSTGHKRKGFDLLVAAFAQLPQNQFQLVVAGSKPKNQAANCHYVGFVNNMAEIYSACDITILPSLYEPFGLVVLESIQCGTPVIVSRYVGAKDLVSDKEGIVLEKLDADAILSAILTLKNRNISIEPNFAERKQLTVKDHVEQLKQFFQGLPGGYQKDCINGTAAL